MAIEMFSIRWRIEVFGLSVRLSRAAALFVSQRPFRARVVCFTSTTESVLSTVGEFGTLLPPKIGRTLQIIATKFSQF